MIPVPYWLGIVMLIIGLVVALIVIISGVGSPGPITIILTILYFAVPLYILLKDNRPEDAE